MLEQLALLRRRVGGKPAAPEPAPASPAPAPAAPDPPSQRPEVGATLRRVGDVWTIDDGRTSLHLNDGRGVRLLALLLEHPGLEIHSLDLVAIVDGTTAPGGPSRSGGQETGGRFGVQGSAGPRLDAKAKSAYRARLDTLRAEIAEAVALGDSARAGRARDELAFVTRELELGAGIGGRDRAAAGSHAERARVNVTRAIRSTLKRVAGYDARLGRELETAIRTGTWCVYEPDPRHPRPLGGRGRGDVVRPVIGRVRRSSVRHA